MFEEVYIGRKRGSWDLWRGWVLLVDVDISSIEEIYGKLF